MVKSVSGGANTVSIYSGSSVIAEYDNGASPGAPTREYIYNGAGDTTGLLAMIANGATTYYHQDHLSVRLTTDGTTGSPTYGQVLSQQGTYPYGEQWYQSGAANKFVFTSYSRDSESGLDYALARYYDSRTGTFCSADPLAGSPDDPQSWNRYAYGRNNPIGITDPSGQSWAGFFTGLWDALIGFSVAVDPVAAVAWAGMETLQDVVNGQGPPRIGFGGTTAAGYSWNGTPWGSSGGLAGGIQGALGLPTLADVGGPIFDATQAAAPSNPKCSTSIMQPQYTSIFGQMGTQLKVNPLFIMSTALQESGWNLAHVYGTNSSSHGQPLNNLFGMTNAGGNNIAYPNVQASANAWITDWGSYLVGTVQHPIAPPATIQAYAAALNSNPHHMYNSNPAYPRKLAARYKQLVGATAACGTTF